MFKQTMMAGLVLMLAGLPQLQAAEESSVDALAKEGHWVKEAWEEHSKLLGQPAPKLELSKWINGEVTQEKMKGKIVVVDFWATWCGPCKAAIPHTNEIMKKYADKGVLVVGACGGGAEDKMGDVVKTFKMEYPTGVVTKDSTVDWHVKYWPTYAIIDREGKIRALGIKPDYVEKIVDAILKEQPAK